MRISNTGFKNILVVTAILAFILNLLHCSGTSTQDLLNGNFVDAFSDTTPPSIISPADGSVQNLSVVLQWTAKAGAKTYTVEVTTDNQFGNQISGSPFIITAPTTSYTLSLLQGDTYFWRVRADTTATGQYGQASFNSLDNIIYVYCPSTEANCSNLNDSASGTKAKPFGTIARGLTVALAQNRSEVRVASRGSSGNTAYLETLALKDGINLTGGYNNTFSVKNRSLYPTVVHGSGVLVANASLIYQPTLIDSIQFINVSTGLSSSYGVKIDNCSNELIFSNVIINGGSGSNAYGVFNTNLSTPVFLQTTITTGSSNTAVRSIGIYNDLYSIPSLDGTLVTTGPSNGYTVGIFNVPLSSSGANISNSEISSGPAVTFSAGIAGGVNITGGVIQVDSSKISSGTVVNGNTRAISADTGSITKSIISPGLASGSQKSVYLSYAEAQNVNISGNTIYQPMYLESSKPGDSFAVKNNTVFFDKNSNGITLVNPVSISQLKIDNNIIMSTLENYKSKGIVSTGVTANINSLSNNLFSLEKLLFAAGTSYTNTCSSLNTVGTGTLGTSLLQPSSTFVIKNTALNSINESNINGIFTMGNYVFVATETGLSISADGGLTWQTKTTANGLGNNLIAGVYADGSKIYVATSLGLSISTDGLIGNVYANKTLANGLPTNNVRGVYVDGSKIYVATSSGLSISTDGLTGNAYVNKTTANGLASNNTTGVYVDSSKIYVISNLGLSISTDGLTGNAYVNKTTANGLGSNNTNGVYVDGSKIYVATAGGLSISTDGLTGNAYVNKTTANGLGSNNINGVMVDSSKIYVATGGGLSISTDGLTGNTYTNQTPFSLTNINSVSVSPSRIYLGTNQGVVMSKDGLTGNSYTEINTGMTGSIRAVFAVRGTNRVYVATIGSVAFSNDNGNNWTNISGDLGNITTGDILVIPGSSAATDQIFVAAGSRGLYISPDGGMTWSLKTTTNGLGSNLVNSVFNFNSTLYVGTSAGLSISTDGLTGNSFVNKTTAHGLGSNTINKVFVNNLKIYAATGSGISVSTDGLAGNSYASYVSGNSYVDIMVTETNVFAARSSFSSLYKSSDGLNGSAYTLSSFGGSALQSIFAFDSSIISGNNNELVYSNDNASSNNSYTSATTGQVFGLDMYDGRLFAAANNGLFIFNVGCQTLLSGPTTATGNKIVKDYSGIFTAGFNYSDPKTWVILASGPADIDGTVGWSASDIGADATNVGPTVIPGAN